MSPTTNGTSPRARARATDADVQIGAFLRRQRVARGWTQTQMGDLLGVTYQQMHKYETGRNRLSAGALIGVLAALGVDLADFAHQLGAERAASSGPKMSATTRQVHERVARLTISQQRGVLKMLEALCGSGAENARG